MATRDPAREFFDRLAAGARHEAALIERFDPLTAAELRGFALGLDGDPDTVPDRSPVLVRFTQALARAARAMAREAAPDLAIRLDQFARRMTA
jgi:hypothetical protein